MLLTTGVRYQIQPLQEIVPEDEIKVCLSNIGFHVIKINNIINAYKPILKAMYEQLPSISDGPIFSLSTDYKKITSLNEILKNSGEELDKVVPPELQYSELFIEAYNHLGQFNQYIPMLTSNQASSMASYVPALQQSLSLVVETLDKVLALAPKCFELNKEKENEINFEDKEFAHYCVCCNRLAEHLIIDLSFLSAYDAVNSSSQITNVKSWVDLLTDISEQLRTAALTNIEPVSANLKNITTTIPSLFAIYSFIQGSVKDIVLTTGFAKHIIQYMNLIFSKVGKPVAELVSKEISKLTDACFSNAPIEETKEIVSCLLSVFSELTTTDYVYNSTEANTMIQSVRAILTISQDQQEITDCAFSLARCISTSLHSKDNSDIIDRALQEAIGKLLNAQLSLVKGYSLNVTATYTKKIDCYSENSLSQVNYHTSAIDNLNQIDPNSDSFITDVQKLFSATNYLPYSLNDLVKQAEPQDAAVFRTLSTEFQKSARQISSLYDHLVSMLSVNTQMAAEMGVKAVQASNGQIQVDESLKSELDKYSSTLANTPTYLSTNQNTSEYINLVQKLKELLDKEEDGIGGLTKSLMNAYFDELGDNLEKLKKVTNFEQTDDFVSNVGSLSFSCLPTIQEAQQHYDDSFAYKFSHFYSAITRLSGSLENAPESMQDLKQFPQAINASLNTILPLITNQDASNRSLLSNYVSNLSQMMMEFQSAIDSLPQPFLQVDIPAELRQFRKLESSIASLPTSALRITATNLMDLFKDAKSEDALIFLTKWFEMACNNEIDCGSVHDAEKNITRLLNMRSNDEAYDNEVIEALVRASVAATRSMADLAGEELEFMEKLNNDLINKIKEYIDTKSDKALSEVDLILDQMANYKRFIAGTPEEKQEMLETILSTMAEKLSELRDGKISPLEVAKALKNLLTYGFFNDKEMLEKFQELVDKTIDQLLNGEIDVQDLVDEVIRQIKKMRPDRYEDIMKIEDQDKLCDEIYNRAEMFREYSNIVVRAARQNDVPPDVVSHAIMKMSTIASESAAVALRSMEKNGLEKTNQIQGFASNANDVFSAFSKFEELARNLQNDNSQETVLEVRRLARTMAKKIDAFINTVERPLPPVPSTGLDEKKNDFFHQLSKMEVQCSRVISRINSCPLSEMLDPEREGLISALTQARDELKRSADDLYDNSVEPQKSDFKAIYEEYESKINAAIEHLKDNEKQTKKDINESTEIVPKLIEAAHQLTDHIIVYPDPESAARIPDEFNLPPMPTEAPSPQESFKMLCESLEEYQKNMDNFSEVYNSQNNSELVELTLKLREEAEKFASSMGTMTFSTTDPRCQVEEQTIMHEFASAFTALQNAIKAKLLLDPTAESQITESIAAINQAAQNFKATAEKAVKSAEIMAQKEEEVEFEPSDAVTAELQATALAIEEMSAKLSEFGSQFGQVDDVVIDASLLQDEEDEDENESTIKTEIDANSQQDIQELLDLDSFIKFIIAQARAILKNAGDMLKRAMQITANLIASFGHIDNERMMINSAQDLTEAAGLIMTAAEMLIKGTAGEDPEFKVIAAARIVKGSVAQLVAQVLVKGGDPEGIMNMHVKTVRFCSNQIVRKSELRVAARVSENEKGKVKKGGNKVVQKLNAQQVVNDSRTKLQESEQTLYKYRKANSRK